MAGFEDTLQSLPAIFTGGAGVGAGVYFFKWFFDWIGARVDRKEEAVAKGAARLDEATQKLIERLQAQLDGVLTRLSRVESELDECRAKHAEGQQEIARLRGVVQGLGDARQTAATIVASERVVDRISGKIAESQSRKE